MAYTVRQLAKLAGVTARTLHHYDKIGLLKPSFVAKNGYRQYEAPELRRLQQILFFRELDFSLDQIKAILDSPYYSELEALKDQRKVLRMEKERLDDLIRTINKRIKHMKNKEYTADEELYGGLTKTEVENYKQEIREKYGDKYVDQSEARMKGWDKADYDRVFKEGQAITQAIAEMMGAEAYNSPKVQEQIRKYHAYMQQFYDCSKTMFAGLGRMYVEDTRFTAYYEKIKPGLAEFMRDAMVYYAEQK